MLRVKYKKAPDSEIHDEVAFAMRDPVNPLTYFFCRFENPELHPYRRQWQRYFVVDFDIVEVNAPEAFPAGVY